MLIGEKWNEFYNGDLFPVGTMVTIKYQDNASETEISEFESLHNLELASKDIRNYHNYHVAAPDLITLGEALLESPIVMHLDISTTVKGYGSLADGPGGGGDCSDWADLATAWGITMGSPTVKVAVIDGGIDIAHPDLGPGNTSQGAHSNIYVNTVEQNGVPNHDDDGNGYDDDIHGWNFLEDNSNVQPNAPGRLFHGTGVAGIVAGKANNNFMLDGVAGGNNAAGVKIIPIKILDFVDPNSDPLNPDNTIIADAIYYAVNTGARIINMSWYTASTQAIKYALDFANAQGVMLVSAAGNFDTGPSSVKFPAFYQNVIAIGATQRNNGEHANKWDGSCYGPEIDFATRGRDVCVIYPTGNPESISIIPETGTSLAAPFVSGVAALMMSAHECLNSKLIYDILKATALKTGQKPATFNQPAIPYTYDNTGHSVEYGYGVIDHNLAVEVAKDFAITRGTRLKDLFIKDEEKDLGIVNKALIEKIYDVGTKQNITPYTFNADKSPDIWIRNSDDNGLTHENPDVGHQGPVYVYVRVRNIGCVNSSAADHIKLYWSSAASWTSWPANWDGSNPGIGNMIGWKSANSGGPLKPGEERIYKFEWNDLETAFGNGAKACLMVRIESTDDPITDYPNESFKLVNLNNNVAMHNITIVNTGSPKPVVGGVEFPAGGFMNLPNVLAEEKNFDFILHTPDLPSGKNITSEAEVSIRFDQQGWNIFNNSGQLDQPGITKVPKEKKIIVRRPHLLLDNIRIPAETYLPVYVGFNFLVDSITDYDEYNYTVSQRFQDNPEQTLGSNNYIIRKNTRELFQADAGPDQVIGANQQAGLSAVQITEPATYNWYDVNDSLIYSGPNLMVTPAQNSNYKLEVIATADGFKDYDEAQVTVKEGSITNLYPNPTSSLVTVEYHLNNVTSAYIMVVQPYSTTTTNFLLNTATNTHTIDLTNFPAGVYNLVLVCDGVASDLKTVQKQ